MKLRHYDHDSRARFVTCCTHRRIPLLSDDSINQIIVDTVFSVCRTQQIRLLAYVIMPEHVHLLIQPQGSDYDIAAILKAIKQPVARRAKRFLEEENPVWLKRLKVKSGNREVFRFWQAGPGYDRNIRDEKEMSEKLQYIHNNPVKRGLAARGEDWLWSSAGWYLDRRDAKITMDGRTDKGWHGQTWFVRE